MHMVPRASAPALRTAVVAMACAVAFGVVAAPAHADAAAASAPLSCVRSGDAANTITTGAATVAATSTVLGQDGTSAKAYAGAYIPQATAHFGDIRYVAYYAAGTTALTVAEFKSGTWTSEVLRDGSGNTVGLEAGSDSHDSIAMAVDPSGGLHVLADMHSTAMRAWQTTRAGDVTSLAFTDHLVMTPRYNAAGTRLDDEGYVTYPVFFTGPGGVLSLMWRSGWSTAGKTYIYEFAGGAWKPAAPSTQGMVLDGWTGSDYSPYPATPYYNPSDMTWNLVWTWQDDGTAASTSTVDAMKSTDLVHWTTIGGAAVTLPVTYGNASTTVDPVGADGGLRNSNIQPGVDPAGTLTVTYAKTVSGGTQLVVARPQSATAWTRSVVSSWTGYFDPDSTSDQDAVFVPTGTTAASGGATMLVDYTCAGQTRRATLANGAAAGSTVLVSDAPVQGNGLPAAVTATEFPTTTAADAGYALTYRLAEDPSPNADGTQTVLRWESGAIRVDGSAPPAGTYPPGGSTLTLFALRGYTG